MADESPVEVLSLRERHSVVRRDGRQIHRVLMEA
jgi:hypothetical protein